MRRRRTAALSVLVLQHHAGEHAGSLRGFLDQDGHLWRALDLDAGGADALPTETEGWDALLVLGGTMHVWEEDRHPWLRAEKILIRDWVRSGRPYLGICLGHQLLAAALGGEVGLMRAPEIGVGRVALTPEGLRDPVLGGALGSVAPPVLQWHHAEVARLPDGAVTLASNPACPVQAMRVGRAAWGVQFHPEVDARTLADWRAMPDYAADLNGSLGQAGRLRFEAEVDAATPGFERTARRLYDAFMAQAAGAATEWLPPSSMQTDNSTSPSAYSS